MGHLVLTLRPEERVKIGADIEIITKKWARILIRAPRELIINRLPPVVDREISVLQRIEAIRASRLNEGKQSDAVLICRTLLTQLGDELRTGGGTVTTVAGMQVIVVNETQFLDIGELP
jgi:sRNA-binding carbon storage regulator CsrA